VKPKLCFESPKTENDLIGTAWPKYLHYRSWFRKELAEFINDVLVDARTRQMPFWNSSFLESLASDHIRGRKNYVLELNAVLTLEAVERLLLRDAGAAR
jgi:asparagine synthase (glutamine-hydrolysing)